jgi:predicted nucleotidyltransferase
MERGNKKNDFDFTQTSGGMTYRPRSVQTIHSAIGVSRTMNTEAILRQLLDHKAEITEQFAVERLALFGSAARDEMTEDSDVDLLVSFRGRPRYAAYLGLKHSLEQLIGRRVDLVTETGLKPRARQRAHGYAMAVGMRGGA